MSSRIVAKPAASMTLARSPLATVYRAPTAAQAQAASNLIKQSRSPAAVSQSISAKPGPLAALALSPLQRSIQGAVSQGVGPALASLPPSAAKEAAIAAAATVASPLSGGIPTASPQTNPQVPAGSGGYDASGGGGTDVTQPDATYAPPPDIDSLAPDDQTSQSATVAAKPLAALALQSTALATVPAATATTAPSFWSKLLALFGFGKKAAPATTVHGDGNSLQELVESVVRRTRNGDQNAMALMAMVRDNAKKGNPRAQQSMMLFQEYIRCNPVGSNPRIGADPDYVALTQAAGGARWGADPDYVALTQAAGGVRWGVDPQLGADAIFSDAVALSHGPMLTNPRIGQFLARFGAEEQAAIRFGLKHGKAAKEKATHPTLSRAIRMGKILHQARKLQAVRMHGSPIHDYNVSVGWELEG